MIFTRSRPFRKNDNCFVEQKNYSIVRRIAGYYRYDNDQQLATLNELYAHLRLYTNFFQPVMKLLSKERIGSIVRKRYDAPLTPCQRLLAQPTVSADIKAKLTNQFDQINPAELKRSLSRLQHQLFVSHSPLPPRPTHPTITSLAHPWRQTDTRCKNLLPLQTIGAELDSHSRTQDTSPAMELARPP